MPIMPRAKYFQTLVLNLLGTCIGSVSVLLAIMFDLLTGRRRLLLFWESGLAFKLENIPRPQALKSSIILLNQRKSYEFCGFKLSIHILFETFLIPWVANSIKVCAQSGCSQIFGLSTRCEPRFQPFSFQWWCTVYSPMSRLHMVVYFLPLIRVRLWSSNCWKVFSQLSLLLLESIFSSSRSRRGPLYSVSRCHAYHS